VNYVYINRNFDISSIRVLATRLTEAGREDGSDGPHDYLTLVDTVKEAGYVYVYVSNDGEEVREVYFDDFSVEHVKSPVISSQDYYPFGLAHSSYQRESSIQNRYLYNQGAGEKKFNTERVSELELNVDQSRYRTYDFATGRWWQVDPKGDAGGQESWSTYQFAFNNPIRYNDPMGDCPPEDGPCYTDSTEEMTNAIAGTVSDGVVGLYNLTIGPLTNKQASNDADGISIQYSQRKDPESVSQALSNSVGNGLKALSIFPSSGATGSLLSKVTSGVSSTLGKWLVRFGDEAESVEKLASDAAKAEKNGFPHGVSTKQVDKVAGSDKVHKSAEQSEVEKVFTVEQTGSKKSHHTVILPKPVTQEIADLFNSLFKPKN
jgi:RHS repeat-associated protein